MGPFSNPYVMAMIASITGGRGFNGMVCVLQYYSINLQQSNIQSEFLVEF